MTEHDGTSLVVAGFVDTGDASDANATEVNYSGMTCTQ